MFKLRINNNTCIHNEDKIFKDLNEMRIYLNDNFFHGLEIIKKNTLYSIASRPQSLINCPYKDFICIEKIKKADLVQ